MLSAFLAWLISAEALKLFVTFIVGGGLVTLIKTYFDGKEVSSNSKIAKIKLPVEIDALQVTGLETLAKNLQADNEVLRADRDYWKGNYEIVREQVEKLSDELERQEEANHRLRREVDDLRHTLAEVERRSPAALSNRKDLRENADSTYPDSVDYQP